MYVGVFEAAELESTVHLPRNPIAWPEINRSQGFEEANITGWSEVGH